MSTCLTSHERAVEQYARTGRQQDDHLVQGVHPVQLSDRGASVFLHKSQQCRDLSTQMMIVHLLQRN